MTKQNKSTGRHSSPLEIPYRIETAGDIKKAMKSDLLGLGLRFREIQSFARGASLQHPSAFAFAKKKVSKDFIKIEEEKIQDANISYHQIADLPFIDQYAWIENAIPWVHELTCHETLFRFLQTLPPEIRERCLAEPVPDSPSRMYEAIIATRKLLRREMIVYLKAGKLSAFDLLQFRRAIIALTLFDPGNDDILAALKTPISCGQDNLLQQNALAELLFARLPTTIQLLMGKSPNSLAAKLFARMSKLNFSTRQVMNARGYIKPGMTSGDLSKSLDKIESVAMRMTVPDEAKEKLRSYIGSLKRNIARAPMLYSLLFLNRDLEVCQRLYRPTRVMRSITTLSSRIVKVYTHLNTLDFYPTKDYFDTLRGKISHDCIDIKMGEQQLLTPQFFNIRIFERNDWIGNIYMLDFSKEHGVLLIDRIQIARDLIVLYFQFFDHVRDVLINMFADVAYQEILAPLIISNHATVQKIYHTYRKRLGKRIMTVDSPCTEHFESIKWANTFYILSRKTGR